MAILDAVKNQVQSQVAARANSTIRSGLTKVAGNLLGINTQFDGPQLGAAQPRAQRFGAGNKYNVNKLMYPLDVQEDPHQGHYIFFNIYEMDEAKLKARRDLFSAVRGVEDLVTLKEGQIAAGVGFAGLVSPEEARVRGAAKLGIENVDPTKLLTEQDSKTRRGNRNSSSMHLRNPATKKLDTTIALYMPPSVTVNYAADYNDANIGVLASVGAGIIQGFKDKSILDKETVLPILGEAGVGAIRGLLATLDTVAPGSKALAQFESGRAITPKMELMFNGIGRREFSYEFTFIPKSERESDMIKQIITQFKRHMLADYVENMGHKLMHLPSVFEIEYQYMGKRNEFLNRVSTCALQSVDVTYGGDRFQAHADGVPQTSKLSLKFKELEIITRKLADEGY